MDVTCSAFIAVSIDGYIARPDGDLEWLSYSSDSVSDGDYGYSEFINTVDAIIMGRNTFEKVLSFGTWPYDKKVIVLTNRPLQLPSTISDKVWVRSGEPSKIIRELHAGKSSQHFYIDGGITIRAFLKNKMIDRFIITRVPIILGNGIPLFGKIKNDIRLHHESTRSFSNGLVQSIYRVQKS